MTAPVTQEDRDAQIDAIAAELKTMNNPEDVALRAARAKAWQVGQPVRHVLNPKISGIVSACVTEQLCIGITTEAAGLSAAFCFVDPVNLAAERKHEAEVERLREALRDTLGRVDGAYRKYGCEWDEDDVAAMQANRQALGESQ